MANLTLLIPKINLKYFHCLTNKCIKTFYLQSSSRKSALLSAAKKAKLKSHPSRVRFAESVDINGALNVSIQYRPTARRELMMTIFKAMSFVQNCKVNMITMILIRILINCTLKIQNSNGAAAVNYFIFKLIFHEYK